MSTPTIQIQDFLKQRNGNLLVDVRSEGEFKAGHIPGAINIPVLNNEERKEVGTLYKQVGKEKAVLKGFELAGPRFHEMMKLVLKISKGNPVIVYCWRGGMRSEIFTWLMQMAGLQATRIAGGYKKYRIKTYETVRSGLNIRMLSGKTGCGKTSLLLAMKEVGFQVIDLEGLASHKGSVFGGINMPEQPFVEHFENILAEEIWKLNPEKPVWIENENQLIGKVILPVELKTQMMCAPMVNFILSNEKRYENIKKEYGILPQEELVFATKKLEKRLGNLRMREAISAIEANEPEVWIPILMEYYDKGYGHALEKLGENKIADLEADNLSQDDVLKKLKEFENDK